MPHPRPHFRVLVPTIGVCASGALTGRLTNSEDSALSAAEIKLPDASRTAGNRIDLTPRHLESPDDCIARTWEAVME
jgi:hypothetical protein